MFSRTYFEKSKSDLTNLKCLTIERLYAALISWTLFEQRWQLTNPALKVGYLQYSMLQDFKKVREDMRGSLLQINFLKLDLTVKRNSIGGALVFNQTIQRIQEFKDGLGCLILEIEKDPENSLHFFPVFNMKDLNKMHSDGLKLLNRQDQIETVQEIEIFFDSTDEESSQIKEYFNPYQYALPPIVDIKTVSLPSIPRRPQQPITRLIKSSNIVFMNDSNKPFSLSPKMILALIEADKFAGGDPETQFKSKHLGTENLKRLFNINTGTSRQGADSKVIYESHFEEIKTGPKDLFYKMKRTLLIEE